MFTGSKSFNRFILYSLFDICSVLIFGFCIISVGSRVFTLRTVDLANVFSTIINYNYRIANFYHNFYNSVAALMSIFTNFVQLNTCRLYTAQWLSLSSILHSGNKRCPRFLQRLQIETLQFFYNIPNE